MRAKLPRPSWCAVIGSVATVVSGVQGIPGWLHTALMVVAAAAVALLGVHARTRMPFLLAAVMLGASGCALDGFGLKVASPPFGSLQLRIGGAVVGSGATQGTNLAELFNDLPEGHVGTNSGIVATNATR